MSPRPRSVARRTARIGSGSTGSSTSPGAHGFTWSVGRFHRNAIWRRPSTSPLSEGDSIQRRDARSHLTRLVSSEGLSRPELVDCLGDYAPVFGLLRPGRLAKMHT